MHRPAEDVLVCGWLGGLSALSWAIVVLTSSPDRQWYFEYSSSLSLSACLAWIAASWSYLGCCLYIAELLIEPLARAERTESDVLRQDIQNEGIITQTTVVDDDYQTRQPVGGARFLETDTKTIGIQSEASTDQLNRRGDDFLSYLLNHRGYSPRLAERKVNITFCLLVIGLSLAQTVLSIWPTSSPSGRKGTSSYISPVGVIIVLTVCIKISLQPPETAAASGLRNNV